MEAFELLDKLGEGAFGVVWKARNKLTGDLFAIKEINEQIEERENVLALPEVEILRQADHPNVLKLIEVIRSPSSTFLVLEYCEGSLGTLMHRMRAAQRCFTDGEVRTVARQLFAALQYLRKLGVLHRDIKPDNILLKDGTVKLADFGSARFVDRPGRMSTYVGTRWYRAPEMLLGSTDYGYPSDIWAVGAVLGEMYAMEPVFIGSSVDDQLYRIFSVRGFPKSWSDGCSLAKAKGIYPPSIPPPDLGTSIPRASRFALNVLDKCLKVDPAARSSLTSLLAMPFFKKEDTPLPAIDSLPAAPEVPPSLAGNTPSIRLKALDQERKEKHTIEYPVAPEAREAEERIHEEAIASEVLSADSRYSASQEENKPRSAPSRAGENLDEGTTAGSAGTGTPEDSPTEEPKKLRKIHSARVKPSWKSYKPKSRIALKRKAQKLQRLASLRTEEAVPSPSAFTRAWSVDFSRLRNVTPAAQSRYPKREKWIEDADRARYEKSQESTPPSSPGGEGKKSRDRDESTQTRAKETKVAARPAEPKQADEAPKPTLKELSKAQMPMLGPSKRSLNAGVFEKVSRSVPTKVLQEPSEKGPIWLRGKVSPPDSHPTGWASHDSPSAMLLSQPQASPPQHQIVSNMRKKNRSSSMPHNQGGDGTSSRSRANPLPICHNCMSHSRTPSHHAYAVAAPEVPRYTSGEYSYPSSFKEEDTRASNGLDDSDGQASGQFEKCRNDSRESFSSVGSSSVRLGGRGSVADEQSGGWFFGEDSDSDAEFNRSKGYRSESRASYGSLQSSRNGNHTPLSSVSAFTSLQRPGKRGNDAHFGDSWLLSKLESAHYSTRNSLQDDNAESSLGDEATAAALPQGSPLQTPPVLNSPAQPIVSMSEANVPPSLPIPAPIALRSDNNAVASAHAPAPIPAAVGDSAAPSWKPPTLPKKQEAHDDATRCILCGNDIPRYAASKISSEDATSEENPSSPAAASLPQPTGANALPGRATPSGPDVRSSKRYDRAHGMGTSVLDMLISSSSGGGGYGRTATPPKNFQSTGRFRSALDGVSRHSAGDLGRLNHRWGGDAGPSSLAVDQHEHQPTPPPRGLERFSDMAELSRIREEGDG